MSRDVEKARRTVLAHRKQTAYTPRADQCQACRRCVVACPERAIQLAAVGSA
jgi:ferredoxin